MIRVEVGDLRRLLRCSEGVELRAVVQAIPTGLGLRVLSVLLSPDIMSVIRCTSMIGSYTARFTVPRRRRGMSNRSPMSSFSRPPTARVVGGLEKISR